MRRILLFITLLSMTLSCTDSTFEAVKIGNDRGGLNCDPKIQTTQNFVSSFEKQNTKIILSDFLQPRLGAKIFNDKNETIIKKGTELILQVKRSCILQSESLKTLSKLVKTQVRPSKGADFGYFWFKTPHNISLKALTKLADDDSCVIGVMPNQKLELLSLNDPLNNVQSDLKSINHTQVVSKILNEITEEVLVAVVDSGNDQAHPDMEGRHWRNTTEQNGQAGIDDDNNGYVDDIVGYSWACNVGGTRPSSFWFIPHGEHVSGTIAANMDNGIGISGIAGQKAKMMHLNVIYSGSPVGGCTHSGPEDLVLAVQAIQYAAENGAKVINLSMGKFGTSTAMQDIMNYAVSRGAYVATAAGNSDRHVDASENFFYPCGYAKDIDGFSCVAATDSIVGGANTRCVFSNYSAEYVELSAPGCDSSVGDVDHGINGLLSTVRATDTPMYQHMPGTSMASPHIAAAGALVMGYLKSKRGSFPTPKEVEDILKAGSRLQPNLLTYVEAGRSMDLEVLFNYIDSEILDPVNPTPTPCP